MAKLDSNLLKSEPIVGGECEVEDDTETEERMLGTIVDYGELRGLYLERSPRKSDTEMSSNGDDMETEPAMDSDQELSGDTKKDHKQEVLPSDEQKTVDNSEKLPGTTNPPSTSIIDCATTDKVSNESGNENISPHRHTKPKRCNDHTKSHNTRVRNYQDPHPY